MATTLRDQISAKNRAEVEAQTAPDQMWESMSNQYDQQAKQIQQGYDRAYSQADNQLLSRGMGRSSYGAQVLANVNQQGLQAQTENHNNLIAAYQNWLANYNTQQEQFQWQKDSADRQIALQFVNQIAARGGKPSDELLAKAGLSRSDFNAFKYKAPSGGGGSSRGGGSYRPPTNNPSPDDSNIPEWQKLGFKSEAEWLASLGDIPGTGDSNVTGFTLNRKEDSLKNANRAEVKAILNSEKTKNRGW